MNTFGELPNYSLLHTHGFVETNNTVDAVGVALSYIILMSLLQACVPSVYLKETYLSNDAEQWRYLKWQELEAKVR